MFFYSHCISLIIFMSADIRDLERELNLCSGYCLP